MRRYHTLVDGRLVEHRTPLAAIALDVRRRLRTTRGLEAALLQHVSGGDEAAMRGALRGLAVDMEPLPAAVSAAQVRA